MIPNLSIVIVNYNGKRYLHECLNSVEKYAQFPHEIIVVDNASTDGSCEYLRENFPQIYLIKSKMNLGYSVGNNLGAAHAKGDLLLLLNNDTRLMSSLSPALQEFQADKQLGVLGCRMFYGDGSFQPSVGFDHTPLRMVLSWSGFGMLSIAPDIFRRVDDNESHYVVPREVAWVSGAFLVTRKELWDQLRGLDERYFMYAEEVDYCKRVRENGYKVAYTPQIELIHYVGGGKAWVGEQAVKNTMQSYLIYLRKYYSKAAVLFVRSGLSTAMLFRSFAYAVSALFSKSRISKEKAKASRQAAKILLMPSKASAFDDDKRHN